MEIQDTLVYVSMIITVGISMIILTTVESFKNIFLTPQIKDVIYYLKLEGTPQEKLKDISEYIDDEEWSDAPDELEDVFTALSKVKL